MARDRRQVLRLAAAALLLPAMATMPLRARAQQPFVPPARPMLYTRRLERELSGGARFAVSRSFAIEFHAHDNGYQVVGEQVDVAVDAPESLAPFAKLERERLERALFPLMLDRTGLIQDGVEPVAPPRLDRAVEEALKQIRAFPISESERADLVRFARAVHDSAATLLTELPRDLFAPAGEATLATRTLPLPGGEEGVVTVAYTAEVEPSTGLMRSATREVVTDISGNTRRTLESWTLVPHG
jgi:hypothetical protein